MTHPTFIFENYTYDAANGTARFHYSFDGKRHFTETVTFEPTEVYDERVLKKALWLSFLVVGTSYYKTFPTPEVAFRNHQLSQRDTELLQQVYTRGLSQFVFENNLNLDILPTFVDGGVVDAPVRHRGEGVAVLQSGGKDSLLLSQLLDERNTPYAALHISSTKTHPAVLDRVGASSLRTITRTIDSNAINDARKEGGLNGHVPVTYIVMALSLVDVILHGESTVLTAIGREGNEAHAFVDDLPVNHQWSKSWEAEKLFATYVIEAVSPDLRIGSPLRGLSELRIAELFVQHAWEKYGYEFSSCNLANYGQGYDNTSLRWCGECPKCANSFLLFAPFVPPDELLEIFGGQNLFIKPELEDTFKGLLGIEGVMKPLECVGEIEELRLAYHMAREKYGIDRYNLPFSVPESHFDYLLQSEAQQWVREYVVV